MEIFLLISTTGTYTCSTSPIINITGNWTNNKTFTPATSQVNFIGSATQTIGGSIATTFNNLSIANAAGVTLTSSPTVNATLNLSNGLVTTGANTITVIAAGNITNASASSYINGKLARGFASAGSKIFPTGKGGNYRPLTFNFTALNAATTITVEQFEAALAGALPANVTLFTDRYWDITKSATGTTFTYFVTLDPTGFAPIGFVKILKKESGTITANASTIPNYTNTTGFTTFAGTTNGTNSFALGADCSSAANAGAALAAICQGGTSAPLGGSVTGTATGGTWSDGGVGGTFNSGATNLNTTWTPPAGYSGTATLLLTPTGGICPPNTTASKTITVNGNATISLSSAAGTNAQTKCINTAITNITYAIGGFGTTGATVAGLPAGVGGVYNAGVFTISGTPSVSGTFNYTVSTTGPCIKPTAAGTVTVTPNATINLSSAAGTDGQTLCQNTPITNITYTVGGSGTGATVSGLPAGVTGSFAGSTFTISGSPSVSGTFNYTVSTTGPCVKPTANGTITVTAAPTGIFSATETSGIANNDNIICAGAGVTFTAPAGYGSYTFKVNGAIVQGPNLSNTYSTSSLTNGQSVTVDVANALNCGTTFGPIVITVTLLPTPTLVADKTTICAGDLVTFTATGGTNYNFKVNGSSVQSGASGTYTSSTLANGNSVTVDVTNGNKCSATSAAIVITVNALPAGTLSVSPSATICAGDNLTFTASAGFSNYNFKVNGTSMQSSASNTFITNAITNGQVVTVTATNGATTCSGTFNALLITVNALPTGTITTTENSGTPNDNTICAGANVTFTATAGFTNYQFYLRNTATLLQGGASNVYSSTSLVNNDYITVVVTNSNGCTNTFPVSATINVIPLPLGTLTASAASVCAGTNVDFTATAGFTNYNFQVNGTTVQNGGGNIYSTTSLSSSDAVTVIVTNSNGCIATFGPVSVTVNPLPTGILVPVENSGLTSNDGIICTGATIVFTAPTGFSNYDFIKNGITIQSGAGNTYSTSALITGDQFTVAVTNGGGCVGLLNTITVTVNTLPGVAAITGNTSVCLNNTTQLSDATGGGVWTSLDPGIATIDASGLVTGVSAGTATINYTVANIATGCSSIASATVTVNAPPTVAPITGNFNVCPGTTSQLSDATAGGVWSSSDNSVATVDDEPVWLPV